MSTFTSQHRSFLEDTFKNRVSFRKIERKLYSHDIAAIPSLVKPIIGNTIPHAVVQPQSEQELVDLVIWAVKNNIPLTPRGKGSSGYGGILPAQKGIVVDLYHMNKILEVNKDEQTVTVEAGVVWEKLDKNLAKHGLTLTQVYHYSELTSMQTTS